MTILLPFRWPPRLLLAHAASSKATKSSGSRYSHKIILPTKSLRLIPRHFVTKTSAHSGSATHCGG